MLPGVHRVRRPRAGGGAAEYWYAWRGGPSILKVTAKSDALLDREIARLTPAAAQAFEALKNPHDAKFLYGLVTRYLDSAEFKALAPRTQKDRRKHLDVARSGPLGEMELREFKAKGARQLLLRWREGFAKTPKTADDLLSDLSAVLSWAYDRGEVDTNPIASFPRIYSVNRAEAIWEPWHLATLYPHCAAELKHAVRLAILTGLRLGDLIEVSRGAVGEHAITWRTSKSNRRRTVVIPITDKLRTLLAEIPVRKATTILTSARERPWTGSGLESALRRAKLDAQNKAEELHGPEAKSGIGHLRFHDLRGTAATVFVRAGLPLDDVATILGWEKKQVEAIAVRYVTSEAIGLAIVERMRQNVAATKVVKRPVKSDRRPRLTAG